MSLIESKNKEAREKRLMPKYDVRIPYSFTFAPSNQMQKFGQKLRWRTVHNCMRELMREVHQVSGEKLLYEIYQELSTPSQFKSSAGRIHYHGVIYFKNLKALRGFFLLGASVLSEEGIIDLDTIEDLEYWARYCRKGSGIWEPVPVITNCSYSIMDTLIESADTE